MPEQPTSPRTLCVAFDAFGTVIEPVEPIAATYYRAGAEHGSQFSREEVGQRFRSAYRQRLTELATSQAKEESFWRGVVATVLEDLTTPQQLNACFQELWCHFSQPGAWRVFPDVAPVFSALAEREIKILLASNFDDRLRTIIAGFPEFQRIEQAVISSVVGWRKPAPEFYELLIHNSRFPPDSILMVGDDEQNDVLAARQAGLRALQIQRRPTANLPQPHVIHSLMQVLDYLR